MKDTDDFPVEWEAPADAELTWVWEQMHFPRPLSPAGADILAAWAQGAAMPFAGQKRAVNNGYLYIAMPQGPRPAPPPGFSTEGKDLRAMWEQDTLPGIKEICEGIRDRDYEAMPVGELGGLLDELIGSAGDAMRQTFGPFMGVGVATNALIDLCEKELGSEGAVRAATMLQGFENESAAAGGGLSRLAELAQAHPRVASALTELRFDEIGEADGGKTFLGELRRYLDEYGWRAETWGEVHVPTWAEEPAGALSLIRRYLNDPEHSPAAAQRRAVEQREEAVRSAEATLAPGKLDQFRELLHKAQDHVPVSEGRALWQLISMGILRIPLLALGRKLVRAGASDQADDVFHLRVDEMKALAAGGGPDDIRATVSERRADLERWGRVIPPRILGRPPSGDAALPPMMRRFAGHGVVISDDPRIVNGNAASRGTAQGRARVIMSLEDAGRLEAGDILVCPSTAPPWTPLFAIAAAVVTDSGGMLSHSAIAAREYAVPCVAGTQVGTRKIPDGATVTVDGSQGIVRIEQAPSS